MLSYRHAFHAGNHADVLKHIVQIALMRYLALKDKGFSYIDTHAGAGAYALDDEQANKLAEYAQGIGRLWLATNLPELVADYVGVVHTFNADGALRRYPGSPWIARHLARAQDKLRLFELHSTDSRLLQRNFADAGKQVIVAASDGFNGLKACLPPPTRRALVLIDPSYELSADYAAVVTALGDSLTRFAGGTYAVWYPQLQRTEAQRLPEKLKALPAKSWLNVALQVRGKTPDGFGMHGSGMFILNPPWTLQANLAATLPYLVEQLGQDDKASFTLEFDER